MRDPYLPDAPWPCMRGGLRNTGRARMAPEPRPGPVRRFATDGPVFSTPVIGPGEQLYVGSADRGFYRLDPETGRVVWRFETGEVIDSAACLGPDGTIWVPGGDGRIYGLGADGKERWRYDRLADRTRTTPSTIYWWEANVVMGPNGWLYAGNDDFHLYAIEPYEGVRWTAPTGLHIWGAPAFLDDLVLVPSFDRFLYAFALESGRERWRCNLRNFVASSPAVADGLVVVGGFDHYVTAVDAASGRVAWRTKTGAPIYASAAVDGDQVVIGSHDGVVTALELRTGAVRWTRWLGDAIRGSVAVGDALYVPGGDGFLTALERDGAVRWRLDTRVPGAPCNLNASVALGRHGLAVASASGEVLYVPYGAVAPEPPAPPPSNGARLEVRGPGGARGVPVGPGDTVGIRVLHTHAGDTRPGRILEANAPVCPDGSQLHVTVPGPQPVHVRGRFAAHGSEHALDERVAVPLAPSEAGPPPAGLRAERLAVQAPAIVPSFDQIGLASLAIDVGILAHGADGRVVAWGVQRFGMDAAGAAVGVPDPRILYYAFDGTWRDGTLVLESGPCLFEITAFPVPLTRLRLVAHRREGRLVGGSLVAETDVRTVLRTLPGALPAGSPRQMRSWLPERPRPRDVVTLARMARRTLALGVAFARGLHRPWGLVDGAGHFHGLGSFRAAPLPARESTLALEGARVESGRVVAEWRGGARADAPGIVLLRGGRPVAWPYARRLRTRREAGAPVRTELPTGGAAWDEAWVLRDHEVVARLVRR